MRPGIFSPMIYLYKIQSDDRLVLTFIFKLLIDICCRFIHKNLVVYFEVKLNNICALYDKYVPYRWLVL